eukprot:6211307-Pleurochrysis_carterae.AAC.2
MFTHAHAHALAPAISCAFVPWRSPVAVPADEIVRLPLEVRRDFEHLRRQTGATATPDGSHSDARREPQRRQTGVTACARRVENGAKRQSAKARAGAASGVKPGRKQREL